MVSTRYVLSRTFQAALTVFLVMTATFVLVRLLPGGPVDFLRQVLMQGQTGVSEQRLQALVEIYSNINPSRPLWEQYVSYMSSLLQGDLGQSIWFGDPVLDVIARGMPFTIFLSVVSLVLIFVIGISLGALLAYVEGSKFDIGASSLSIFLTSVPYYVVALLMLWYLGFVLGLFPTSGRVGPDVEAGFNLDFVTSIIYYGALPIISLVVTGFGNRALQMRGNSIQILGEDYLRVARLRGLSPRRITLRYVGRNAVLPLYTSIMIAIGSLFGGSIILEQIFTYPGVGYYMFRAIQARDYPLLMGAFLFITIGVVVGVFVADLTYGWIDPRIGEESGGDRGGGTTLVASLRRWWRTLKGRVAGLGAGRDSPRTVLGASSAASDVEANGGTGSPHVRGATGGGERAREADSVFNLRADVDVSRRDMIRHGLREYVLIPLEVIWTDRRARFGSAVIVLYVLMGTVGVLLVERPTSFQGPFLESAFTNWQYPLGTDNSGRSVLGLIVHATPNMLKMVTAGAVFGTGLGTVWGVVAGYDSGMLDRVMMTIADVLITIPGLPLIIVIAAIFEPQNPYLVGVLLTINGWAGFSRKLRSEVLSIRENPYVEASQALGISTPVILAKDLLPNVMPLIMVNFVSRARFIIINSVALYFLGVLPFSNFNWGVIMNQAYRYEQTIITTETGHWFLAPMLTIVLLSYGLLMFGQGCDRLFNARIRARHAKSGDEEPDPIQE